jgi:hypothetical protein
MVAVALGMVAYVWVVGTAHSRPVWLLVLISVASILVTLSPVKLIGHARVSIDPRTREVLLSHVRWPRGTVVRSFPLTRVTDAAVRIDDNPSADATRYMVFLVIEGEAPVPLMEGMWEPWRSSCDRVAAQIRALLGK